jgi:acylphosphatase
MGDDRKSRTENEMADEIRRQFLVRGRVQGVGFRAWTQRRARELELRGWVRNLGDGSVEVCAQGTVLAVERLSELLRKGPPLSRVREVRELPTDGEEIPSGFAIE